MNVSAMKTSELVALYNLHSAKPVNKFQDRATAERRTLAALEASGGSISTEYDAEAVSSRLARAAVIEKEHEATAEAARLAADAAIEATVAALKAAAEADSGAAQLVVRSRAKGIADSWANPEIAAARSERYPVMVEGVEYRSTMGAFLKLKIDTKDVIKLRMALVETGHPIQHAGHIFSLAI